MSKYILNYGYRECVTLCVCVNALVSSLTTKALVTYAYIILVNQCLNSDIRDANSRTSFQICTCLAEPKMTLQHKTKLGYSSFTAIRLNIYVILYHVMY